MVDYNCCHHLQQFQNPALEAKGPVQQAAASTSGSAGSPSGSSVPQPRTVAEAVAEAVAAGTPPAAAVEASPASSVSFVEVGSSESDSDDDGSVSTGS